MLSNTAKKHLFYLVCLVCVIFYSYLLIFGEGGMLRLRQEEKNLLDASRIRNEELRKNQELQHKIDRIRNDQREIERIAREHYKMAQPGEIIINLDAADSDAGKQENPAPEEEPENQELNR